MQIITGITDAPKQAISIPLPDGSSFSLALTFVAQQAGWFFDVAYSTATISFQANGSRLCASPNILRQYQNVIPFGIACLCAGNVEPTTLTAFSDGTITFLLLDASDIADIEASIYTGNK